LQRSSTSLYFIFLFLMELIMLYFKGYKLYVKRQLNWILLFRKFMIGFLSANILSLMKLVRKEDNWGEFIIKNRRSERKNEDKTGRQRNYKTLKDAKLPLVNSKIACSKFRKKPFRMTNFDVEDDGSNFDEALMTRRVDLHDYIRI